jgi:two-component system OmpR family response regulator
LLAPDGTRFSLSKHESTLLELLARHCGHVVSRKRIASAFGVEWINYDDRRLDQMVSRLRKRWTCNSRQQLPFRTEYGKGYCFSAEIEVV